MRFPKLSPWPRHSPSYSSLAPGPPAEKHVDRGSYSAEEFESGGEISVYNLVPRTCTKRLFWTYVAGGFTLCVSVVLVIVCISTVPGKGALQNASDKAQGVHVCGNSSREALNLGCSFDQLMWAWYPPECPHYANEEYLKADDWKFYLDKEGTQVATGHSWEKAMDNDIGLWGERREHLTHCIYMMLSMGQILRDGGRVPTRLLDYEHLEHCATLLFNAAKHDPHWNEMETFAGFVHYEVSCPKRAILS